MNKRNKLLLDQYITESMPELVGKDLSDYEIDYIAGSLGFAGFKLRKAVEVFEKVLKEELHSAKSKLSGK